MYQGIKIKFYVQVKFQFTIIRGILPELDSVRLENNVKYKLLGVKVDDVLATIKRVETFRGF